MIRPSFGDQSAGVTLNGDPGLMSSGKTGMRMLKPTRSMKTVRKIGRIGLEWVSSRFGMRTQP
jgi:hypothetical protein